MKQSYPKGFTLAELLISLGILGVIAAFTLPKILLAQQNNTYNASAKEAAAMISGAYQAYQQTGALSSSTAPDDLTPYMNYLAVDTTSTIDLFYENTTRDCNTGFNCLKLHTGGTLLYYVGGSFGGSTSTRAIYFYFDPDGRVTDGTTNGPGKSVVFWLYYNGRITSYSNLLTGTLSGGGPPVNPDPSYDPPWFSWN